MNGSKALFGRFGAKKSILPGPRVMMPGAEDLVKVGRNPEVRRTIGESIKLVGVVNFQVPIDGPFAK
jgi:hypothetical protein